MPRPYGVGAGAGDFDAATPAAPPAPERAGAAAGGGFGTVHCGWNFREATVLSPTFSDAWNCTDVPESTVPFDSVAFAPSID